MKSRGRRAKSVLTILGPIRLRRSMFQCAACGATRCPCDELLDLEGSGRSPGLRRLMARAGSRGPFKEAAEDLRLYAGVRVSPKDVERVAESIGRDVQAWLAREVEAFRKGDPRTELPAAVPILYVSYDGTGVPMTPGELRGRKGKQADGSARTREAKLGCVFTQTGLDEEGRPVRDEGSTTFVGAIESSDDFGWRIYAEALRRGLDRAGRVVILGDGAPWIRTLAQLHFPGATQIVDLYHARQHLTLLCALLWPGNDPRARRQSDQWSDWLDDGRVPELIAQATELAQAQSNAAAVKEIAYFKSNADRMRYDRYRAEGLFVGSGVVEAGCKSIVGARLKQSGMEWSLQGANAILALRCVIQSGRFEDYWESRNT